MFWTNSELLAGHCFLVPSFVSYFFLSVFLFFKILDSGEEGRWCALVGKGFTQTKSSANFRYIFFWPVIFPSHKNIPSFFLSYPCDFCLGIFFFNGIDLLT